MSSEVEPLLHSCTNCAALLDISEQDPFSEIHCPACGTMQRVRKQFDHFELLHVIASGGMGTVYRAKDINLNRVVALKLLRKEFSADQEYIEKLETEAKITASVNHSNVVKVFSFGNDQGLYYIAMELVDKGSLDDLMNLQGKIAEVQVLEIGIQVAQGLRAAVHAGLIHRDVKPGNILFADAHTAKIVDFGLAMPLEQARDADEEIWGTPYYVAPEKLNHEPEDFRSDIYSLGGTLFHALAGRPPFEAENASLVALKHLKNQAVSLQAFAPDISSPTSYVINRTLAKHPDDRYASYDELIEHLEYARAQLLENSGKPRQAKARVVVESEEEQNILGYILMGVIAFVVLLGIVLYYFRDTIISRREGVQELEKHRMEKVANDSEQAFEEVRKQIVGGDSAGVLDTLTDLEQQSRITQPLKNWVILHEGIVAYLNNQNWDGQNAFQRLRESGFFSSKPEDRDLATFFTEVARIAGDTRPARPAALKPYETTNFSAMGLFVFGLKDWQFQHFDEAEFSFQEFLKITPKGPWDWIASYKPLAQRYVDDFKTYKEVEVAVKDAKTPEQQLAALKSIDAVRPKLKLAGKLPEQLEKDELSLRSLLKSSGVSAQVPSSVGGSVSMNVLRETVLEKLRDLQTSEAKQYLDLNGKGLQSDSEYQKLVKKVFYVSQFKSLLIAAAPGFEITAPIDRKNGLGSIPFGKIVGATDSNLSFQSPKSKGWTNSWSDLTPPAIINLAAKLLKGKPSPIAADADLLWTTGVYAGVNGRLADAKERMTAAAQLKKQYAADLSLFQNSVR